MLCTVILSHLCLYSEQQPQEGISIISAKLKGVCPFPGTDFTAF